MHKKKKSIDVMFYEVYEEEERLLREHLSSRIKVRYTKKTIQESGEFDSPAKIISIRTQSRIPVSWAKNLSGILARTQGYDHLASYQKSVPEKIAMGYLGSYCSRAVAEHAIMSMMVLWRKAKKQMHHFNTFLRDGLMGKQCFGRRALVVGVGNIGTHLVDMLQGLGLEVRGVDIKKKLKKLKYVSLRKGVIWADVIFCALPLTPLTKNMLDYHLLKQVKSGALFVNISRGEIAPIKDLKRLLSEKKLGGLSLDVFEEESFLADHLRGATRKIKNTTKIILRLKDKENVFFTPHNAFNTQEALEEKVKMTVKSIDAFLKTKKFLYPVS